jgi:hypothetical protein
VVGILPEASVILAEEVDMSAEGATGDLAYYTRIN